jgi:hypothetical protein
MAVVKLRAVRNVVAGGFTLQRSWRCVHRYFFPVMTSHDLPKSTPNNPDPKCCRRRHAQMFQFLGIDVSCCISSGLPVLLWNKERPIEKYVQIEECSNYRPVDCHYVLEC